MIDTILFDLDGTLGDPYEGISSAIQYALASVGMSENDPAKLRSYIGPPLRGTFALYGFDDEDCEKLVAKFRELYQAKGIHQNRMYDGVKEMLEALKKQGCKIALASCKPEKSCKVVLEDYGVTEYFDEIAGATFDKSLDTKPAIIAEALRRLGISEEGKNRVLMVGDRDMDIIGAHENGIRAVGAAYGYAAEGELAGAKADFVADCPLEVAKIAAEN